jgi:hypothetical protein
MVSQAVLIVLNIKMRFHQSINKTTHKQQIQYSEGHANRRGGKGARDEGERRRR